MIAFHKTIIKVVLSINQNENLKSISKIIDFFINISYNISGHNGVFNEECLAALNASDLC